MDIGSILLTLALVILVGFIVARPFFDASVAVRRNGCDDRELSRLIAERERLLSTIVELEDDRSLGKLTPEDYSVQRDVLLHQGADISRQIEGIQKELAPVDNLDAEIRRMVAVRRRILAGEVNRCPKCGKILLADARFCSGCGSPVGE